MLGLKLIHVNERGFYDLLYFHVPTSVPMHTDTSFQHVNLHRISTCTMYWLKFINQYARGLPKPLWLLGRKRISIYRFDLIPQLSDNCWNAIPMSRFVNVIFYENWLRSLQMIWMEMLFFFSICYCATCGKTVDQKNNKWINSGHMLPTQVHRPRWAHIYIYTYIYIYIYILSVFCLWMQSSVP